MDFDDFNSIAQANTGSDMHIKHPASGELLYADKAQKKPCIVTVLGQESTTHQKQLNKRYTAQKARTKKSKDGAEDITLEQLRVEMVASATQLIVGFKNVHRGKKPATVDDADWFVGLQLITFDEDEKSFAEQVIEHAKKRANFLGRAPLH